MISTCSPKIQPVVTLTKREVQILNLIANEMNSLEIASHLYISEETVKTHRKNIRKKMGVRNVAGMVTYGIIRGQIKL